MSRPIMTHALSTICYNCGKTYGQHRMADDACPQHPIRGGYRINQRFELVPATKPTSE
jgi:hypothetical protein